MPPELVPPDDPNEAIAQLREELAAALKDASTKDSEILELRRQLAEAQAASARPSPAQTPPKRSFLDEVFDE